ncbi:MAG: hypothetical protein V4459_02000 [Pseudomonadota bacterium]
MKPQTLMTLRRYHSWLGVFFAPAIILFSISGALQTFRLQEEKGYGGTPPNWIVWLASVHKDQAPPHEERKETEGEKLRPAPAAAAPKSEAKALSKRPNTLPLKIFVVLMSLGLLGSTIVGLTIALSNRRTRSKYLVALVAGAVLPCVLLWL